MWLRDNGVDIIEEFNILIIGIMWLRDNGVDIIEECKHCDGMKGEIFSRTFSEAIGIYSMEDATICLY